MDSRNENRRLIERYPFSDIYIITTAKNKHRTGVLLYLLPNHLAEAGVEIEPVVLIVTLATCVYDYFGVRFAVLGSLKEDE